MSQGEEEIIIIGGGGPRPKQSISVQRVDHLKAKGDAADPYDLARAMIDEAEALQQPVTFETRKAKG
jgi:hypothetical protein